MLRKKLFYPNPQYVTWLQPPSSNAVISFSGTSMTHSSYGVNSWRPNGKVSFLSHLRVKNLPKYHGWISLSSHFYMLPNSLFYLCGFSSGPLWPTFAIINCNRHCIFSFLSLVEIHPPSSWSGVHERWKITLEIRTHWKVLLTSALCFCTGAQKHGGQIQGWRKILREGDR